MPAETITREDLATLLEAKDAANKAYSTARRTASDGADTGLDIADRVALDLVVREALTAAVAADNAYDAAMQVFLADKRVAA